MLPIAPEMHQELEWIVSLLCGLFEVLMGSLISNKMDTDNEEADQV